jgi:hypothetical protein
MLRAATLRGHGYRLLLSPRGSVTPMPVHDEDVVHARPEDLAAARDALAARKTAEE